MFIKDLQARQTDVDVEADVLEVSDVREFNKYGRQGRVASAIISDGTGKVKLSLWNDQIDKVRPGDKVIIQKGYVGEFQGELQLTTGKFGTLEVVKNGPESSDSEAEPKTEEEAESKEPADSSSLKEEVEEEPQNKERPEESLDVEEEDLS